MLFVKFWSNWFLDITGDLLKLVHFKTPLVLTSGGYWSMNGMLKRAVHIPLECFFVIQVFVNNDMRTSLFILIHLLQLFSVLSRKLLWFFTSSILNICNSLDRNSMLRWYSVHGRIFLSMNLYQKTKFVLDMCPADQNIHYQYNSNHG